jgi:DNA-binding response OmpR family regulator
LKLLGAMVQPLLVVVHVRRLRAKLGPENENLIGTVRNVGYRYVTSPVTESHEVLV